METGHIGSSLSNSLQWLPDGEPKPGRIARVRLRSQADIDALEQFPAESLLPSLTIYRALEIASKVKPEKPAVVHLHSADLTVLPRMVTYAELIDRINRLANVFVAASQGQQVAVAMILPMVPEALIATWAATAAGVALPINPFLEPGYVVSILNAARVTILVTSRTQSGSCDWGNVEEIVKQVPTIRRVLIVDSDDPQSDYETALLNAPSELTFLPVSNPDATATYQLTGGTTGAPKLIRLTHRGTLINAWVNGALQGTSIDAAVGHAMPNFHIGGAVVIALRTIIFSQTLVTLTREGFRNPDVVRYFWDIARHHRLTAVLATPTTAAAILAVEDARSDGHCIEAFACGGSTIPLGLSRAFHKRFGVWLREQWGLSEAQGTVSGHLIDGAEPVVGSVGYALPYYRIKTMEVDSNNRFIRECAPGERGIIAVSGYLIPGYVDGRLDDQLFIEGVPDGIRWCNTGDLGSLDSDGYVWVFGRAKDLIIRGGHNIDPKLIEDVLSAHPAVQLAAAIGRPDISKGELPIAYVQTTHGSQVTSEELIRFCRDNVQERAAIPVEIVLVECMPTTPVGKISKPALRKIALAQVARSVAARIIGEQGISEIAVDDTGKRIVVTLTVHITGDLQTTTRIELEHAFAKFEFSTVINTR